MSHTRGVWRCEHASRIIDITAGRPRDMIATVFVLNDDMKTALSNGRLMAAAPDLLVACQAALNDRMFKDWPEIAQLLINAIAKAEGR